MQQTVILKLFPTPAQEQLLADVILGINAAANRAAEIGFREQAFSRVPLHRHVYAILRHEYGLLANHAQRAIDKVTAAFERDRTVCPVFRLDGAVPLDRDLYCVGSTLSISTLKGRQKMAYEVAPCHATLLATGRHRQADLVKRDGTFYLHVVVETPDPPVQAVQTVLGVDLGIVNLATTSEGVTYSGAAIDANRKRRASARRTYQRRNTRGSRRRLRKMARRQARFQAAENHRISKEIIQRAKALNAGIALEDLTGIRRRVEEKVDRLTRQRIGNWGFAQLGGFIRYKARREGVPVAWVDPRNTSRTCSRCGHCEKKNRRSQAVFRCVQCSFSLNADHNAAKNIARIGASTLCPD